jgi:cytochrome c oxidase cbb3-type subunit 2
MPAYPWLAKTNLDADSIVLHLKALKRLGDPYSDEQILNARKELAGKTELDALVAYLQGMGIQIKSRR